MGKGARRGGKGDQHFEFFKKNITDPYSRGMNDLNVYRQTIMDDFKKLKNLFPEVNKKGGDYKNKEGAFKKIPNSDFTYGHAIRAYLWTKSGYDIPGLSKTEARRLNQALRNPLGPSSPLNYRGNQLLPGPAGSGRGSGLTSALITG